MEKLRRVVLWWHKNNGKVWKIILTIGCLFFFTLWNIATNWLPLFIMVVIFILVFITAAGVLTWDLLLSWAKAEE